MGVAAPYPCPCPFGTRGGSLVSARASRLAQLQVAAVSPRLGRDSLGRSGASSLEVGAPVSAASSAGTSLSPVFLTEPGF